MARPIRDFQTETARSGDATRAYGRFGDGSDWLQAGITAMERAGNEIGRVISERVEQANRLEDATVRSEAIQKTRLQLDERLRGLDPRAPEYSSEVERALSETIQSVVSETNWRRSSTREQFLLDAAQLRTQTILSAADQRERAVVNAAKEQVDTARNRAVAAIAQAPGTRDIQLLQLENEIGPILANIRPDVRDAILKNIREVTAEEAARGFINLRNFSAAEQALRAYGGQGLLSPQAVRQLRAGLEAEKRQAEAEARAAAHLAASNVRSLYGVGLLDEGNQVLQEALRSGAIRRDSTEHKVLMALAVATAEKLRDRGFEAFNQAVANISSAGGGTANDEQVILDVAAAARLKERLARFGPEALASGSVSPEVVAREELAAREEAREFVIRDLIARRPHKVPVLLENMVRAAALDKDERARVGDFLNRLRAQSPGVVAQVLRHDPTLGAALDEMRLSGQSITAESIGAWFSRRQLAPRSEEEWNKLTRKPANGQPELRPDEDLNAAITGLITDRQLRGLVTEDAQMRRLREDYKRFWLEGHKREDAARFAVRGLLSNFHLSRAASQPVWLPRENAPETHLPAVAFPRLKEEAFATQVLYRVASSMAEAMNKELEAQKKPANLTARDVIRDYNITVTATPVLVDGQPRTALVAHRQHRTSGAVVRQVLTGQGQPWQFILPASDDVALVQAEFNRAFNLDGVIKLMEENPGKTLRDIYDLDPGALTRGLEALRDFDQWVKEQFTPPQTNPPRWGWSRTEPPSWGWSARSRRSRGGRGEEASPESGAPSGSETE